VVNQLGQPVRPEWYSDRFRQLARAARLPKIRLHDARRSAATLMLHLETPVHVVAAWLGTTRR
jgi:integrase